MHRILLLAATLLLAPTTAIAQDTFKPGLPVTDSNPAPRKQMCWSGTAYVICPTAGTVARPSGASSDQIQGNAASGSPDIGNPVEVGYRDTAGNRQSQQGDTSGNSFVTIRQGTNSVSTNVGSSLTGSSPSLTARAPIFVSPDGTTTAFVPARGDNQGLYSNVAPSSAAAIGITPVTGSLVSSITAKAAPGNLYSATVTSGGTALYLYVFNSLTAPADGAVVAGTASGQYQICAAVPATATFTTAMEVPERYSVGITPVTSTTACGTLTKSATAVFLKARAQ